MINGLPAIASRPGNEMCTKTDTSVFDSICPRNLMCTRNDDTYFVRNYNSLFKTILGFFGINGVKVRPIGGKGEDEEYYPMSTFAVNLYCQNCIDQAYSKVLSLPEDGPATFTVYKNPFSTSPFANSISEYINTGFTFPKPQILPPANENEEPTLIG